MQFIGCDSSFNLGCQLGTPTHRQSDRQATCCCNCSKASEFARETGWESGGVASQLK